MAMNITKGSGSKKRRHNRRSASPMSEINVTPMVDVMLVLLIIFMVAAPLMSTGIKVNLPDSNTAQLDNEKEDEPLQVVIDKTGKLYINKNLVSFEQIAVKLLEVTKQNKEAQIFVRGDKDANYGDIIRAISAINEAGFTKVGLVTQPKP
jgi:biopolymer transport protein TolR